MLQYISLPRWLSGKEFACRFRETWVWFLNWENPLEKEMATHSSILAWRISWTEEPGGYSPRGCKGSDATEYLSTYTHASLKEKFQNMDLLLLQLKLSNDFPNVVKQFIRFRLPTITLRISFCLFNQERVSSQLQEPMFFYNNNSSKKECVFWA